MPILEQADEAEQQLRQRYEETQEEMEELGIFEEQLERRIQSRKWELLLDENADHRE